ncbi:hypothetical protein [Noviherbaspirillum pedocola]|uniref:Uncharacterized protein n=1 Tax=Noviherbaspirillum pedocola TaxID=2801341 RepID=A0A934SU12_9BURK|nr:hypothetical protein [Noviherbaspirillum pedocola]MBK4735697.1 hypothetical protein [Noviherbaspirillum pedocola]
MNPADKRMREAALSLHALHWRDREWLLRRLLPGMRTAIRSLLKELRALGIAPEVGLGDVPCPDVPDTLEGATVHTEDAAIIDAASPADILRLFTSDAQGRLTAVLMQARAWRWRQAVWDALTPLQKKHLTEAIAQPAHDLPQAWRGALLHAYAAHLRAPHTVRPTP